MKKTIFISILLAFLIPNIVKSQSIYKCDICNEKIQYNHNVDALIFLSRKAGETSIVHKTCHFKIKDFIEKTKKETYKKIDEGNKTLSVYKMQKSEFIARLIKKIKTICENKKFYSILHFVTKQESIALKKLFSQTNSSEFKKYHKEIIEHNNHLILYNTIKSHNT